MFGKVRNLFSKTAESHRPPLTETVEDGSVRIEGKTYALRSWSRNGFVVSPSGPHFSDGDEVSIDVTVPLAGEVLEFSGLAMVSEVDAAHERLACRFLDIERPARAAIDRHFDALEAAETG